MNIITVSFICFCTVMLAAAVCLVIWKVFDLGSFTSYLIFAMIVLGMAALVFKPWMLFI